MAKPNFQKISSWDDFEKKLITLNKKEKGDYFEYLTKYYLKIDVKYQSYDQVWLLSELPNKEREYLGFADKSDIGIDLIAKNGNEYYAIQCKYHSDFNSSVTRNEIAPFLTMLESNPKITKGFVASTANTKSPTIKKSISKPLSYLLHDTWDNLSDKFFKDIQAIEKGKAIKPSKPLSPRPHQKKALKDAVKHFEKENEERGKLIFPCGAGKSLTGFWMTQQLKSKATLIAVPSLSLVKQTLEVYLQEIYAHGKTVKWLCICSDDGIGKTDDVVYYTEDLGVPCETDPEFIEQWLKENQDDDLVVFTTYQSGRIIADISQKLDFTFDVGIYDEAHKTVGSNKKLFSHLLFEENISVKKRIFMTATERFYGGSKDDIISMDDMSIYGDTFTQMSFKEAIESNLLTDYKVITIDVKKSEISEFIKRNPTIQLNDKWKKETEARSLASMLALRKAMKKFDIKNAVSFHSSIEKAVRNKELQKHITDTYDFQPIDTFTVSGKQGTTKRNQIVKEFAESSKALITNAKCLTEGVDVPNIDCIVFSDPKRSKVDIVQALGRALRKKDGKEWGYVVLPVIYDEKTNEIDNDNFDEILAIVRGLASNDERVVEYFRDKNQKENTGTREGSQFQLDVVSDYMDEEELTKQLDIKLWEKLSRFNWMPFEEARRFVQELALKSSSQWREYSQTKKKPLNIPKSPNVVYRNHGWISWGDFLGTGRIADQLKEFREFYKARQFVRSLNLKNQAEWSSYCKSEEKPNDIPANPYTVYKSKGWKSLGDWLGNDVVATRDLKYREFEKARKFIRTLHFTNQKEWKEYCQSGKKPKDIPANPNRTYDGKGWVSFGDWLGTYRIAERDRKFKPFKKARTCVRKLHLINQTEWQKYSKSGKRPTDIPSAPDRCYDDEWISWRDWLGLPEINYLSFQEAKEFAISLNLKKVKNWREYCNSGNKPNNIPSNPDAIYKDKGWKGYMDFLGTSGRTSNYRDFVKARVYTRSLGLKSIKEWKEYCKSGKKPNDLPAYPDSAYKENGWKGYSDFLGFDKREFKDARTFVRKLGLSSLKEWQEYCKSGKKPNDIPALPKLAYKNDGWKGTLDWLGFTYLSYIDAKNFVIKMGITNAHEWRKYCKSGERPRNIPSNPEKKYAKIGWTSWGDFFGTETIASINYSYREFKEAREFAQSLKLKSTKEWKEYCKSGKKPNDIPARPRRVYKDKGWIGMGDWLGTGIIATFNIKYRSFNEAKEFSQSLKLKSSKEWREFCKSGKRPYDIPTGPDRIYKDVGWVSWGDWLGTGNIALYNREYMNYKDAKRFVHSLELNSGQEWKEYCQSGKKPEDIPVSPHTVYRDKGWIGMGDWLGTGNVALYNKEYKNYGEAKDFANSLNLFSKDEWMEFCKLGEKPNDIPANPHTVYKSKGWKSWSDWLGKIKSWDVTSYLDYKDASIFVRALKLKSKKEWKEYCQSGKKPDNIPTYPSKVYSNKWKGFNLFLGVYIPFEEAKKWAVRLKLKSHQDWLEFNRSGKRPKNIPANPSMTYGSDFTSYEDFLGYKRKTSKRTHYLSFLEAKEVVRNFKLNSNSEWRVFAKSQRKPKNIPASPEKVYKNQWKGWPDFLGKDKK